MRSAPSVGGQFLIFAASNNKRQERRPDAFAMNMGIQTRILNTLGFGECDDAIDRIEIGFNVSLSDGNIMDAIHDASSSLSLHSLQERLADILVDKIVDKLPERHKDLLSMYFNCLDTHIIFNGKSVDSIGELSWQREVYDTERLKGIACELGWSVSESKSGGRTYVEFGKCYGSGQRIGFSIEDGNADDLMSSLEQYIGDYRAGEEAVMIAEKNGFKNVSPSLADDCEQHIESVRELRDSWEEYLEWS